MAATVKIEQLTGQNDSIASCTISSGSLHLGTSDETSPSTIPVPSSGSNYSYWATTQLLATVAADNSLTNIKWYSDGTNSLGTGVDMVVGTASGYASAVGVAGSSGCALNITNHDSLAANASPAWQYTSDSSSRLSVAGSIAATTGSFGDRVVLQIQVEDTAGAGNTSEETLTFLYDES